MYSLLLIYNQGAVALKNSATAFCVKNKSPTRKSERFIVKLIYDKTY